MRSWWTRDGSFYQSKKVGGLDNVEIANSLSNSWLAKFLKIKWWRVLGILVRAIEEEERYARLEVMVLVGLEEQEGGASVE